MPHIALAIRNGEEQRWRDRVAAAGLRPTPVMDGDGQVLLSPAASLSELATDQPGLVFELGLRTNEDCALVLIDRSSMAAFESEAFRDAAAATGRKRLIIGGLHTEVCL